MLAVAGVTAIEESVLTAAATVSAAVPLTPLSVAVIVDEPAATDVDRPAALMVAAAVLELLHMALEVTFAVEPSLYVAVAVNCCVAPAVMLAVAGVTAMELTVLTAAVTVSAAAELTPLRDAVIVEEPAATAVAMPPELMLATEAVELVHVANEVTSAVVPLL